MKKILFLGLIGAIGFLFTGCGNKQIQINAVAPASVPKALNYKDIAVLPIKRDNVGLTSILEQKLMNKEYKGNKIFHIVSRAEIKDILAEQEFSNSGAVNEEERIKMGNISGVDALIIGTVNDASESDLHTYKTKVVCSGEKCEKTVRVRISCINRTISLSSTLKMVDAKTGDLIVSKTFPESYIQRVCEDSYYSFPDTTVTLNRLAELSAERFVSLISPTSYKLTVAVVEEEPKIDLTSEEEKIAERAINRLDKKDYFGAEKLFKQLNSMTSYKSYIASFDLGVIEEAKGNYDKAEAYYRHCEELLSGDLSDNEELFDSLSRIKRLQKQQNLTLSQTKSL